MYDANDFQNVKKKYKNIHMITDVYERRILVIYLYSHNLETNLLILRNTITVIVRY